MTSRIEQLIDEIETYIDNCKPQPLSQTKIIVNKEEIDELLRELRSKTPEEIKRYQKIISNKEAILNDARKKAQELIDEATVHTNELINEHEIMQQAYAQANEVVSQAAAQAKGILDNAMIEANEMKAAAVEYTDQLLADVEAIIQQSMDVTSKQNDDIIDAIKQHSVDMVKEVAAGNDNLLSSLAQYSEIIRSNRADLRPDSTADSAPESPAADTQDEIQVVLDAGVSSDNSESNSASSDESINLDMLN